MPRTRILCRFGRQMYQRGEKKSSPRPHPATSSARTGSYMIRRFQEGRSPNVNLRSEGASAAPRVISFGAVGESNCRARQSRNASALPLHRLGGSARWRGDGRAVVRWAYARDCVGYSEDPARVAAGGGAGGWASRTGGVSGSYKQLRTLKGVSLVERAHHGHGGGGFGCANLSKSDKVTLSIKSFGQARAGETTARDVPRGA